MKNLLLFSLLLLSLCSYSQSEENVLMTVVSQEDIMDIKTFEDNRCLEKIAKAYNPINEEVYYIMAYPIIVRGEVPLSILLAAENSYLYFSVDIRGLEEYTNSLHFRLEDDTILKKGNLNILDDPEILYYSVHNLEFKDKLITHLKVNGEYNKEIVYTLNRNMSLYLRECFKCFNSLKLQD